MKLAQATLPSLLAAALAACSPQHKPTETADPLAAAKELRAAFPPARTNLVAKAREVAKSLNQAVPSNTVTAASVTNSSNSLETTRANFDQAAQELYKLSQAANYDEAYKLADETLKKNFNSWNFTAIKTSPSYLYAHLVKAYAASEKLAAKKDGVSLDDVKKLYDTAIGEAYQGCMGKDAAYNKTAEALFANAVNFANKNKPELVAPGGAWAIPMGFVLERMNAAR